MKPGPNTPSDTAPLPPLLAFGAHPDDIEFGCGPVIALETRAGRREHLVVCSRGEAATRGDPRQRTAEAQAGAAALGASIEFLDLGGDAHFEIRSADAIRIAEIIRRIRPGIVLAHTTVPNQHPDHWRLGQMVRDAARLARYGGVKELVSLPAHAIDHLLFYAVTPDAEPPDTPPLLIDVSDPSIITAWTDAMKAHASQVTGLGYIELQLTRARLRGMSAGIGHAVALYPGDPLVFPSLSSLRRSARTF